MLRLSPLVSTLALLLFMTAACSDEDEPAATDTACAAVDCGEHGICSEGRCFCADGFQGLSCEFPPGVDPCGEVDCGEKGTCDQGQCVCSDGFQGDACQFPPGVDPCEGVECGDNGVCEVGQCVCSGGFSGPECDVPPGVDPCEGIECGEHGACDNGQCVCSEGFTGDACDVPPVDACEGVECGEHGSCSEGACVCRDGFSGSRCDIPPGACENEICEGQTIFNSPIPKTPVVGYVGGSNFDGTFRFDDEERLGHYDLLIVGFVNFWEQARHTLGNCQAPAEAPLDSAPVFLSNACIQGPPNFLAAPPQWNGCTLMQCGGTGEGSVGDAVLRYQEQGGRILMSVGGANSDATNMDPEKGHALALAIWNMFLGGTDPRYVGFRPFGPHVVLDGVDLDLEQSPLDCPSGRQCLDVQEGWHNFVVTMRGLMDADTRKEYLITAVPINSKQADPQLSFPGFGAYTYGYLPGVSHCSDHFDPLDEVGTAALDAQPPLSVYSVLYMVDFLWPQFYPSPIEITMNGDCWDEDLLAWTRMAARHPQGGESRCRVGVGVPFSRGAANGGQIDAALAFEKIRAELTEHPILRAHFGGVFGWDEYWDHTENQGAYSRALSSGLADQALQDLVD